MSSCQSNTDNIIIEKNKCFDLKLKKLQGNPLYEQVVYQFKDTFEILRKQKTFFGLPEYVTNKIDDAVFFNKDSTECILIVLKRMSDTLLFGAARIVSGISNKKGKWNFEPSMEFSFEKNYFELYKENSFENISKLARYSVLTEGNPKKLGCEIDNRYWFILMKH